MQVKANDSNKSIEPQQNACKPVLVAAPKVETYSKELDTKIRYVQYIPKGFRNLTLEQAFNQIYHDKQFKLKKQKEQKTINPIDEEPDWGLHTHG